MPTSSSWWQTRSPPSCRPEIIMELFYGLLVIHFWDIIILEPNESCIRELQKWENKYEGSLDGVQTWKLLRRPESSDTMALHRYVLLAFIVSAANFQVMTSPTCQTYEYYNPTLRRCCGNCPGDMVKRSACIQDRKRDCANRCEAGYFINWDRTPPQCVTCNNCNRDLLVEVQSCSLHTEAICRCQDGYYCQSPLWKTCGRCGPHRECPPGQGVKAQGTSEKDTECESCPPGTFSGIKSATEKCQPHTECEKLQQKTLRKGNSTTDTVCETSPNSEEKNGPSVRMISRDNADVLPSAGQRYTTPGVHTVHHFSTTPTVSPTTTSTKDEEGIKGNWNDGYIVAMIICIVILLLALAMILKQKLCRLKLWIKEKRYFIHPVRTPKTTVLTCQEDDKEPNSPQRQNSARSPLVALESHRRSEEGQTERPDDKTEMQQGWDHLNNRIEKIYIMNADTVLLGSISEVPSRSQRSVTVECKESLVFGSRYPEQESSKVPGNDLMFSIEEEEGDGTTAKVVLQS